MNLEDLLTKKDLPAIKKMINDAVATIQPATDSPWLDIKQAAEYIRTKPRTLWAKAHNGEIAYTLDGRVLKFNRADLDKYMRDRRVKTNDEINTIAAGR